MMAPERHLTASRRVEVLKKSEMPSPFCTNQEARPGCMMCSAEFHTANQYPAQKAARARSTGLATAERSFLLAKSTKNPGVDGGPDSSSNLVVMLNPAGAPGTKACSSTSSHPPKSASSVLSGTGALSPLPTQWQHSSQPLPSLRLRKQWPQALSCT